MHQTEQKLAKVFSETFQVKRMVKQIAEMKEEREKGSYEIKMVLLRNECIVFKVQLRPNAYKGIQIPSGLAHVVQEVKIVVRKNYPAQPPRLFFMNNNMTRYGLRPFRDYLADVMNPTPWSAMIKIIQIIKMIPKYLYSLCYNSFKTSHFKYPIFEEHFEIDNMFTWKFGRMYPIKFIKNKAQKQGFIFIDTQVSEIAVLEDSGIEGLNSVCDLFRSEEIHSLMRKKDNSQRFLLQVRLGDPENPGKFVLQFQAQQYQSLVTSIINCASATPPKKICQVQSDSSFESEDQYEDVQSDGQQKGKGSLKGSTNDERTYSIAEILEGIVYYESLVDHKMTNENIKQLVYLLHKAIEYYSANGDENFRIYLNKLQNILSNQMAQILLESANEEAKSNKHKGKSLSKQQYKSVVDWL